MYFLLLLDGICYKVNTWWRIRAVTSQLTLIQNQLRQLNSKLTTSTVAQVTDGALNRLSRSVSPRRLRFDDR